MKLADVQTPPDATEAEGDEEAGVESDEGEMDPYPTNEEEDIEATTQWLRCSDRTSRGFCRPSFKHFFSVAFEKHPLKLKMNSF